MKISYNWLKAYVPDIPEPHRLADLFTYHICEVESVKKLDNGDFLFDLGILPNRAHDLLSHQGAAKELSGLLGIKYNDPVSLYKTPISHPTNPEGKNTSYGAGLKIEINSTSCRRYMARIVRGVKVGPSQEWVVKHLESIGERSINNIVDATNIVMYDCGQPTHAFDLRKITNYELRIINAKDGEELKVVGRDGIVAKLKESDLVISSGGKTLALAGVKGGLDAGISDDTTDILIEIANFDPVAVRKTARRLGLLSDSAKRFENDLSPTLCDFAEKELTGLLFDLFPDAIFEDVVDIYPSKQEGKVVMFNATYVEHLLGTKIKSEDIEKILTNYNFEWKKEGDNYLVSIPPLRLDIVSREDMAEEIGRIIGYDQIKPLIPNIKQDIKVSDTDRKTVEIREKFVNSGYREVMTYSFVDKGEVEVLASASDKKFLRTNLSDGLKQSYELNKLNLYLLGDKEIKIFEIGTVFTKDGEEIYVAWNEKNKFTEVSIDGFEESFLQVLGSPVRLTLGKPDHSESLSSNPSKNTKPDYKNFDRVGAPAERVKRQNLDNLVEGNLNYFKMWSLYPYIVRDIAVWVPEGVKLEQLSEIYREFGTELLQGEAKLVDTFTKDGRTSYAFRLIFQSYDRTLIADEVNLIMSKITEKLTSLSWEVR
jgi:phenylalanyl-tRNA synthetase beta chain